MRSIEELNVILGHIPQGFAPFGVSYNLSKKRLKKKYLDWAVDAIDIYGVCFSDSQFADINQVLVWDGDRDFVFSWPTFNDFLQQKG